MDLLYINGEKIDLDGSEDIKITYQANDIATLDKRQASYTNKIKVVKTKNNIRVLLGLSVTGDMSRAPYNKNNCIYIANGVQLINKGWAIIENTDNFFNIHIYDGVIDLYKDIENYTIGEYLDLSEINHLKTINNVVNSFTNNNYRYIIADYNGLTHSNGSINIDYLVPSVNVKYLWDKIQEKINWRFIGTTFSTEAFTNLWLTYPKPTIEEDETNILASNMSHSSFSKYYNKNGTVPKYEMLNDTSYKNWDLTFTVENEEAEKLTDNWSIKVLKDGNFKINFNVKGYISHIYRLYSSGGAFQESRYISQILINVLVNGVVNKNFTGDYSNGSNNVNEGYVILNELKAGDIISFSITCKTGGENAVTNSDVAQTTYRGARLFLDNLSLELNRLSAGNADFNEALSDFKISDFFKEILWHFGLTPFVDKYDKIATFLTMYERLQGAKVFDFSEYYLQRTKESYKLNSYAQKNRLKYKYNDEESSYNDGIITIDDVNLDDEKNVIESKIYTPDKELTTFALNSSTNIQTHVYRIWNKEPNNNNGEIEIKYKGLDKRFYFIRSHTREINASFISVQLAENAVSVSSVPVSGYDNLKFSDIVNNNYPDFARILNDTRIHTIEMHLPLPLVSNFDLSGLYFFKQQAQYYIPNKITFSKTKTTGEFIRVKYERDFTNCPTLQGLTYEVTNSPNGGMRFIFNWTKLIDSRITGINLYVKGSQSNRWVRFLVLLPTQTQTKIDGLDSGLYSFRFQPVGVCENNLSIDDLPGFDNIGIGESNECPEITSLSFTKQTTKCATQDIYDVLVSLNLSSSDKFKNVIAYYKSEFEQNWTTDQWPDNTTSKTYSCGFTVGLHYQFKIKVNGDCVDTTKFEDIPVNEVVFYNDTDLVINKIEQFYGYSFDVDYFYSEETTTAPIKARYSLDGDTWIEDLNFINDLDGFDANSISVPYKGNWMVQIFSPEKYSQSKLLQVTDVGFNFRIDKVEKYNSAQVKVYLSVINGYEIDINNVDVFYSYKTENKYNSATISAVNDTGDNLFIILDLNVNGWYSFYAKDLITNKQSDVYGAII